MPKIAVGRHPKKKGSGRMKEFGYKKCEVWFDATEAELVQDAARKAGLPLATWVRKSIVRVASIR